MMIQNEIPTWHIRERIKDTQGGHVGTSDWAPFDVEGHTRSDLIRTLQERNPKLELQWALFDGPPDDAHTAAEQIAWNQEYGIGPNEILILKGSTAEFKLIRAWQIVPDDLDDTNEVSLDL